MTMRLARRAIDLLGRVLLAVGTRLASPVPAGEQCDMIGCEQRGDAYWLPDDHEQPSIFYCGQHARERGFCRGCGNYWGGLSSRGLCTNCRDNRDFTGGEDDDAEEG